MGEATTDRTVLVLDDETTVLEFLTMFLEDLGYVVHGVTTATEARAALTQYAFDVALIDKNLPDGSGMELLAELADGTLDTAPIIMTAYPNLDSAIDSIRLGARDYLLKPFDDISNVQLCLERVTAMQQLQRENARLVRELTETNAELERLSVRDPLTHLYNHTHLQSLLGDELDRSGRLELACSLLLIDIDDFRGVNDAHGADIGDSLLRELARLVVDSTDNLIESLGLGSAPITARYAGDRLAVVLREAGKPAATQLADTLRDAVAAFRPTDGPSVTASIGAAAFPRDADSRGGLIEAAEAALYAAKSSGKNRIVGYSRTLAGMRTRDVERAQADARLLGALDESIAGREFDFVYQPIVHSDSGAPYAYEALCRPRHDAFPHPGVLIEAAELAGRIGPLGRALRQSSVGALSRLSHTAILFINLHPLELHDPEFIRIEPFMAQWAEQIVLEITEVAGIKDFGKVADIISRLRGAGFRVALDDLGAGYSGLNSLAKLRPDFVKLDMELVRSVPQNQRSARLVKHILEYAAGEGMLSVAEGIETATERKLLTELGCPLLQGFYFSRGLPIADIVRAIGQRQTLPVVRAEPSTQ